MGNHESTTSPHTPPQADTFGRFQTSFDYTGTPKLSNILEEYANRRGGNASKAFRIAILGPAHVGKSSFAGVLRKVTTDRQYSCPVEFHEIQHDLTDESSLVDDLTANCHLIIALTDRTEMAVKWMNWELKHYRASIENVSKTLSRAGTGYKLPQDPMAACKELEFISRKFPKNTPPESPLNLRSPDLLCRPADYQRSSSNRSLSVTTIFDGHLLYILTKTGKKDYDKLKEMQTKEIRKLKRNSLRQDDPAHIWMNDSLPADYLDLYYKKVFMLDNTDLRAFDFPLLFLKLHDIMTEVMLKPVSINFLKNAMLVLKNKSGETLGRYQERFRQAVLLRSEPLSTELVAKELRRLIHELGLDAESLAWCEKLGILSVDKVVRGINKATMTTLRQLDASPQQVPEITAMKEIFAELLKCIDSYCSLHRRDFAWGRDASDRLLEEFGILDLLPNFIYVMVQSEMLGRGGQGTVRKCRDISNDRDLAVKEYDIDGTIRLPASGIPLPDNVLPATAANIRTLSVVKEFQRICSLDHENLVRYYALDLQGTRECKLWLFMELCEGGTLSKKAQEGLNQHSIVDYTRQITNALSYLHNNRVMHLDLKGENVLLTSRGTLKLVDFGMAIKLEQEQTQVGEVSYLKGTLRYMAPEMISAEQRTGRRCDIWSLGCLLLEMLTGSWPKFYKNGRELEEMQILYFVGHGGKPFVPEKFLDDGKQTEVFKSCARYLMHQCLQVNPEHRPSADQVLQCGLLTANMMEPASFIDVAVIGARGSGKSFLINNLRGLKPNDAGSAPIGHFGSDDTECYKYAIRGLTIRFWEIKHVTAEQTAPSARSAACIIVSSTHFSTKHYAAAKTLVRDAKSIYFVRTKIAYDIENRILDGCIETHGKIMKDFKNDLKIRFPRELHDEQMFMVENRKVTEYEFRLLRNAVLDDIIQIPSKPSSSQPKQAVAVAKNVLVIGKRGSGKSSLIHNLSKMAKETGVDFSFVEETPSDVIVKNTANTALIVLAAQQISKEELDWYIALRKQCDAVYFVKPFATEEILKAKAASDKLKNYSRTEVFNAQRTGYIGEMVAPHGMDAGIVYVIDNYEPNLYDLKILLLDIVGKVKVSRT
ncbi:uncharacterized protein LOC129582192 [Paramacrobiotus metropolitanus]|uniref:uncharacterized protein LOC129582192 n=1 Tax=Paramacrobiotus metropolitanus TaxID=2943436 RepID=UPI0024465A9F|nr:uncharacterized protein LOC129582192 [Paramacrobiotus metropolitanus]